MADLIRVNGNVPGWGSLRFKVNGVRYTGFTSISYGEKLESQLVWGMGRHQAPRGGTAGKYTPDLVKVKGPVASVFALKQQVAALSASGRSYGAVRFTGVLFITEPGGAGQVGESHTVNFAGLKWSECSAAFEDGPDMLVQEFSLQCLAIREDGLVLFDDSEGSPF